MTGDGNGGVDGRGGCVAVDQLANFVFAEFFRGRECALSQPRNVDGKQKTTNDGSFRQSVRPSVLLFQEIVG